MPNGFYAPERVLVIAAHCDDIEFGVSGTVARWTDLGTEVAYCIVTDSGSGSNKPGEDLEALKKIRREEQAASAAVVGVKDVRYLDYPDGTLEPTMALRKDLTRLIRQVRPNIVITFDPETVITRGQDYINHPDHRAVAEATLYAVFPSAGSRPIFMDLLDEGLEPHEVNRLYFHLTNNPTMYVDISDTIDRKLDALRCHRSQFGDDVVEMVKGWDAETGKIISREYAESFRVINLKDIEEEAKETKAE